MQHVLIHVDKQKHTIYELMQHQMAFVFEVKGFSEFCSWLGIYMQIYTCLTMLQYACWETKTWKGGHNLYCNNVVNTTNYVPVLIKLHTCSCFWLLSLLLLIFWSKPSTASIWSFLPSFTVDNWAVSADIFVCNSSICDKISRQK